MIEPANLAEAINAYNEGVRAMQEGDSDLAASRWKVASTRDPGMIPALHNLVVYYEQRGMTDDVIATYERMLAYDPFDADALVRQASAYRRSGQLAPAIANYERAISVYPYFRFWYEELATLFDQIGDTDASSVWRAKSNELDADEAEMAFEDGVRQQREGNVELSAAIFEAVLDEQPGNLDARVRLAECLHALGRSDEALGYLAQEFELSIGARALALMHRARFLLRVADVEAAMADLNAAVTLAPNFGRARRLLNSLRAESPSNTIPEATSTNPAADMGSAMGSAALGGGTAALLSESGASRSSMAPDLLVPPADAPWLERIRFMIRQASELASRTGKPGRIAVLFESAAALHPLAVCIMQLVARPELNLFGAGVSRAFFVEGEATVGSTEHGTTAEGWYGTGYFDPNYDIWASRSNGMPIDRMLESAQLAVGSDGFNLMLIVGTGKVREDQTATEHYLRAVPTYQTAIITLPDAPRDLVDRVAGVVPNFVEIVAAGSA